MRYPWLAVLTALPIATISSPALAQSGTSTTTRGQVTLYELPAYFGRSVTITSATPDLATQNFARRAQSVKVQGEWQVCTDAQYAGNCTTISSSQTYIARSTIASLRPASDAAATTPGSGSATTAPGSGAATGLPANLADMDVGDGVEGQDVAFFARPTLDGTQVAGTSTPQTGGDAYCRLAGFTSAAHVGRARTQTANIIDLGTGNRVRGYALRDLLCKR